MVNIKLILSVVYLIFLMVSDVVVMFVVIIIFRIEGLGGLNIFF